MGEVMNFKGKRALVCDDHSDMVSAICDVLKSRGLECSPCYDVAEAFALIQKQTPDVIISDIQMPVLSGVDLIRMLNDHHIHVPVIFLTGLMGKPVFRETFSHGHFEFLNKPVDPFELIQATEKALLFGHVQGAGEKFSKALKKSVAS